MQTAQLHCCNSIPDPALQPAQRLAHGAAGAVSLPCNNRPGNEASIVIADLLRFRIHGFCRNCVGATTPADLRNNRPDCFIHLWLCKGTQIYPFCCVHSLVNVNAICSHWLVGFQGNVPEISNPKMSNPRMSNPNPRLSNPNPRMSNPNPRMSNPNPKMSNAKMSNRVLIRTVPGEST